MKHTALLNPPAHPRLPGLFLLSLLLLVAPPVLPAAEPPHTVVFLVDPSEGVGPRTNSFLRPIVSILKALAPGDTCKVYVGRQAVLNLTAQPALLGYEKLLMNDITAAGPRLLAGLKVPPDASSSHLLDFLSWAARDLGSAPGSTTFVLLSSGTNLPPVALENIFTGDVKATAKSLDDQLVLPKLKGLGLVRISPALQDVALTRILDELWAEIAAQSTASGYAVVSSQSAAKDLPIKLKELRPKAKPANP